MNTAPSPHTVFIVDDHWTVVSAVTDLFVVEGFSVVGSAQDERTCIEQVRSLRPEILVADLNLETHGSGLDMIATLRAEMPDIKIMVFSMREQLHSVASAFRIGVHAYLYKSGNPYQLIEAAKTILQDRLFFLPGQAEALASYFAHGNPEAEAIQGLNDKDKLIFRLLASGHTNAYVASITQNTGKTIANRAAEIAKKAGCDRRDFTRLALLYGVIGYADLER